MNNIAKSVIEYYVINNKLKDLIRTGWKNWNVKRERLESVAEHIYGTQTLAIAMYSQYNYSIDLKKVLFMLAIHELEEVVIGDLTLWDISEKEKMTKGHDAIKEILKDLLMKKEIESLILEFDQRKTKEAKFAYLIDKMECNIQCKLYDEENCVDLNGQIDNPSISDPKVQKLLFEEETWSNMWIKFHQSKFQEDNNFMDVLNYLLHNKISK